MVHTLGPTVETTRAATLTPVTPGHATLGNAGVASRAHEKGKPLQQLEHTRCGEERVWTGDRAAARNYPTCDRAWADHPGSR